MRHFVSGHAARGVRIGEHLPFHARNVTRAPAAPGVYLLYRSHRLIYIGIAAAGATIRERLGTSAGLLPECNGDPGRC
jgi:hypothetical protein